MLYTFAMIDGQPTAQVNHAPRVPWWSFTKTCLAACALCLVKDGLISLDETVSGEKYTLRQLLRHESGLADYGDLDSYKVDVAKGGKAWSMQEMFRRVATHLPVDQPGARWRYSNVGYAKLAILLSELTNYDLAEIFSTFIFEPVNVRSTILARNSADMSDVDLGVVRDYDPGWVFHGLLVGPLSDATQILTGLFNGAIIPHYLLDEMTSAHNLGGPIIGRPWISAGYGLGLMQGSWGSGLSVQGHTGCGPGSTIAVYRCRIMDRDLCIAAFGEHATEGDCELAVADSIHSLVGTLVEQQNNSDSTFNSRSTSDNTEPYLLGINTKAVIRPDIIID